MNLTDWPVYTGNDLGAVYTKRATTFTLWAPAAASVTLHRYTTGTDAEPGAKELDPVALHPGAQGTWRATVGGDLAGQYYVYELTFADGRTAMAVDPYARACGCNGQRGMVLDLQAAEPEKVGRRRPPRCRQRPCRPQRVGGACGGLLGG